MLVYAQTPERNAILPPSRRPTKDDHLGYCNISLYHEAALYTVLKDCVSILFQLGRPLLESRHDNGLQSDGERMVRVQGFREERWLGGRRLPGHMYRVRRGNKALRRPQPLRSVWLSERLSTWQ